MSARRSPPTVILPILATAVVLGSMLFFVLSSGAGTNSAPEAAAFEFEQTGVLPLEAAKGALLGFSGSEIRAAVDEARFRSVAECLRQAGFPSSDAAPATPGWNPRSSPTGDAAEYFAMQVRQAVDQSIDTLPAETRSTGVEAACFEAAVLAFPDPVIALDTWLAGETSVLESLVAADPRVAEAWRDARTCVEAIGFGFADIDSAGNHYYEEALARWLAFTRGTMTAEAALAELEILAAEEARFDAAATGCEETLQGSLLMVRAEYEMAWLEENAARLALKVDEVLPALDPYLDLLTSR